ncbi:hypothetical protein BDR22DRAFT_601857 [Usnea florida]
MGRPLGAATVQGTHAMCALCIVFTLSIITSHSSPTSHDAWSFSNPAVCRTSDSVSNIRLCTRRGLPEPRCSLHPTRCPS